MNRAAVVYLVMLVVLVGGLWTVLAIGSSLEAPQDLAGKWQLSPAGPDGWGPDMQVEQSGRFFQVFIDHGPRLDLKRAIETDRRILLTNSMYQVTFTGLALAADEKQLLIEGPQGGRWTARRVSRKYPSDLPVRPTTKPVATSQEVH